MTSRPQPADFVDAYMKWAVSSIDAWASGARKMMGSTRSGAYSVSDWYEATGVWAGSMAKAMLDLYATCAGARGGTVVSEDFAAEKPKKGLTEPRSLRLSGPLQAMVHAATISPAAVRIVPSTLSGNATAFHLEVDPANLPGDAYWGHVQVLRFDQVLETVDVMVQVP